MIAQHANYRNTDQLFLSTHPVVFIDSSVEDYQSLVNGVIPGAEVIVLDSQQDGVGQITAVIAGRTDIATVHIISHGSPGCLYLGNSQLCLDTLDRYATQLQSWFTSACISPPLLLYGCNVASGDVGVQFIERLHQLTGTEIAASSQRTGCAELSGDWELEVKTGAIATSVAFQPDVMQAYTGVLAVFAVTNTLDDGSAGTLRWAIAQANASIGADTIIFNILDGGFQTINLTTSLPVISESVFIDGWSQGGVGYTGSPLIELNGAGAGVANGLVLSGLGGSTIQGLAINRFNLFGISVQSNENTIQGNYIGTDLTGTVDLGNGMAGVQIFAGSQGNMVGTNGDDFNDISEGNLISGNDGSGIVIQGDTTSDNIVAGNLIGTDVTGNLALGNGSSVSDAGISINSAVNNIIGGDIASERNIVSGNTFGIVILGTSAIGNQVSGNYIGTNIDGTVSLGNSLTGIAIEDASYNIIGGETPETGNVISGNQQAGIAIFNPSAIGNLVQGNYIGTDVTGTADLGNGINGVFIQNASFNTIGGTTAGAGNTIAFNTGDGITVAFSTSDSIGNTVSSCTGNIVAEASGTGNRITGNSIYDNTDLGIDLGNDGVTANSLVDASTVATHCQNTAVLQTASVTPTITTVTGILNSPANTDHRVEFFSSPASDPTGFGEGQTFLGFTDVITDASGNANFSFSIATSDTPFIISSTVINANENTSEFSNNLTIGTLGADHLVGIAGIDNIWGFAGDDIIQGLDGDDIIDGGAGNDTIAGGIGLDIINGGTGNDTIAGGAGLDIMTGGGNRDLFIIEAGDGTYTITDFGGVSRGTNPSAATIAEADTLQFVGAGLTARNMLLTQNDADLEITFEGVPNTLVILSNFALENLDNLRKSRGASVDLGNILFDGQTVVQDSFDVFDATSTRGIVDNRNSVTFLNDRHNNVSGFDNAADVINAQGGNDRIQGRSGNDLLRGGTGNDNLSGGSGNDILVGDAGNDTLTGGRGRDQFVYKVLGDAGDRITDFQVSGAERDTLVLTDLFDSLGYNGSDPLTDGYLKLVQMGNSTLVQIDADGLGIADPTSLVSLDKVLATNLAIGTNILV